MLAVAHCPEAAGQTLAAARPRAVRDPARIGLQLFLRPVRMLVADLVSVIARARCRASPPALARRLVLDSRTALVIVLETCPAWLTADLAPDNGRRNSAATRSKIGSLVKLAPVSETGTKHARIGSKIVTRSEKIGNNIAI